MVPQELKIGCRASPLSLRQVEEATKIIQEVLPEGTTVTVVKLSTPGDQDLKTPLTDPNVPDDFFTRTIDDAMLNGEADLSIHSAKDLPETLREGLTIAALLPTRDIRDAMVFRKGADPEQPPKVIGTSSGRRAEFLETLYPNADLKPIRGNMQERFEQLDNGDYDAVIMAACALDRLGLADRINAYLPYDPTPNQGRLALVVPERLNELVECLSALDVRKRTGLVALLERTDDPGLCPERAVHYRTRAEVTLGPQTDALHWTMLREAEKGLLVAVEYTGDPTPHASFLEEWGVRFDVVGSPPRFPSGPPKTLYVGTSPENFLTWGPLIHRPLIQLASVSIEERVKALHEQWERLDGVIFPSRFAVRSFVETMTEWKDVRALQGLNLLAIGPATAEELKTFGLTADCSAPNHGGVQALGKVLNDRFHGVYLYPCSDASPQAERVESVKAFGIELRPCPFYTNRRTPATPLPEEPFARVLFSSASTVDAYFEAYPSEREANRTWLAVGPSTLKRLEALGIPGETIE